MKDTVIFSGGRTDLVFAAEFMKDKKNAFLIAADRGLEAMMSLGFKPNAVIGDFDSASKETIDQVNSFEKEDDITVIRLNPVKDDTDTEAAVRFALENNKEPGDIYILGGTGSRIDHILGNISVLGLGRQFGKKIILLDESNKIELLFEGRTILKEEAFGDFVSLIPFGDEVTGLTLKGFKYPLKNGVLKGFNSLGISNEIVSKEAQISFDSGVLIMVQSKD